MLLVRARAGVSRIHGIGLIAQEFIPSGARVWELRPEFDVMLTVKQVLALSPHARDQVLWYAFWDPFQRVFVLSSDDDRFTNHSDSPNIAEKNERYPAYAIRDIHPGDEITWDYRSWGGVTFESKLALLGS